VRKIIATITAIIGGIVAATASGACYIVFFDEPNMPKSLIK
jgi:cyclic lactone autoinducer peptide